MADALKSKKARRRAWPPSTREALVIASILAVNLWVITPVTGPMPSGLIDRFGHLKGTDFVQFYAAGTLVRLQQAERLYDHEAFYQAQIAAVPASAPFRYLSVYPPQSAVVFAPLSSLPYGLAAIVWVMITAAVYLAVTVRASHGLGLPRGLLAAGLIGFPPFWQLIMHGGSTAWPLAAFGLGGAALMAHHRFAAGLAFGLLAMKPQLGLVLAVMLIASREWRIIAGIATSWAGQLLGSIAVVGVEPWLAYLQVIQQLPALRPYLEPAEKVWSQHSLMGFVWLPARAQSMVWLTLSAIAIYRTWLVWSRNASSSLKMGTLVLASVLVSPHLLIYDAAVLPLAVFWLAHDRSEDDALDLGGWTCLLVLTLLLPTRALIGVQCSVLVMGWIVYRVTARPPETVIGEKFY